MPGAPSELDHWEVRFDENGELTDDGGLRARLPDRGLSDLYVFAHGWNNSEASARDLYRAMFGLLAEEVRGSGARVGTVGVFWPSLVFPEDDPTAPPAAPSTGQELADAMRRVFAPSRQHALDNLGALLDARPADPEKLREAHRAIVDLLTSPDLGAVEDGGERAILTGRTAAVFGHFAGMAKTDPGDAQGAGGLFDQLWGGVREAWRAASYYEMKNRAGVVGRRGLGALLAELVRPGGSPALHLLGHSFGSRLVAFALSGLPADRRGPASPVKSLSLIQGAFSHFSFARPMPIDATRDGALAGDRDGVDGPMLATFSAADRALGWWYPAASLLSHSDSESADDLTYRWGAMGHDGYQQHDVVELVLQPTDQSYAFERGRLYRLRSDNVIATDQSPLTGAHSDIRHAEILHAVVAAAHSTRP